MLFVLFGLTLKVGQKSRSFFESKGYELIKKYNYTTEKATTASYYDKRNEVSEEEVKACDFVYELNGMYSGFNKSQIIDAVRGRKDCVLSLSPNSIDFIKHIKSMYGEYVTTVYVYIDEHCLKRITESVDDMPASECIARQNTGANIRKTFSENREIFDEIAVYAGEGTAFDTENLCKQYSYMIDKAVIKQKKLNDRMYVELPYSGTKDYIFVSYSHKDIEEVLPVLAALQRTGYRIWYDEGIYTGENWAKMISEKIKYSTNFVLFCSKNAISSNEIKSEINGARRHKIDMAIVRVDGAEFDDYIEDYITIYQSVNINNPDFFDKIQKALSPTTRETK